MSTGAYTGKRIAHYGLGKVIGKGGFGEVYEAKDLRDGKKVAVKLLLRIDYYEDLKSFIQEARILDHLKDHPNIVQVLDIGLEEGSPPYLVMELAPGGSLLSRHALGTQVPLARVVAYTKQVAAALQFAHNASIVHHDVKPGNMLVGANNQILLSDFGVAEANHSTRRASSEMHRDGTSPYMPPEKILQGLSRKAGDQYSLAVVVYQWLTGRLPFDTELQAVSITAPALHTLVNVPPAVARVVARGMARDPDQRYASVLDFALALERASKQATHPVRDAVLTLTYSAALTTLSFILGNLGRTAIVLDGGPSHATIAGANGIYIVLLVFGLLPLAPQLAGKLLGIWRGAVASLLYLLAFNILSLRALPGLISPEIMWHDTLILAPMIPIALLTGYAYKAAREKKEKLGCAYSGLISFAMAALFWYLVLLLSNGPSMLGVGVGIALALAVPIGIAGGLLDMFLFNMLLLPKNGKVFYPSKFVALGGVLLLILFLVTGGNFLFTHVAGFSSYAASALPAQTQAKALDSYWDNNGDEHINYISSDGHVHELVGRVGGNWKNNDLTALSKGTPASSKSALNGYWSHNGREYVHFISGNGHVHELTYSTTDRHWSDRDLTSLSGGTSAGSGSALVGYAGSDGSLHINFVAANGHIHEFYYVSGAWSDNDLTTLSGGGSAVSRSALAGYLGSDGSVHVNFIAARGHVHELYWLNGWSDNDLTSLSQGTVASAKSALSAYLGSGNSIHVHFIDGKGHIHELTWSNGWSDRDLTSLSRGTSAVSGSALTGYRVSDSNVHVEYMDSQGHVHELTHSSSWSDNDLTSLSNGVAAGSGSALTVSVDSSGILHVNFIGKDEHVYEYHT